MSGVGLNHDPDGNLYVVPSSYDARWDDEGYQFPAADKVPVMRQRSVGDRHGFIFHPVCYSLLQEVFYPREVPVARLLEVCKSFPFQRLGLSWGHDYGGIVYVDHGNHYPWEDQDIDVVEQPEITYERADPWNILELKELLQGAQLRLLMKQKDNSTKLTPPGGAILSNCFTRLPLEILEYIVAHLPTDDVRALSRTAKELAMIVPSKLGQSFWASRFRTPFELDFIFEAKKYRDRLDWKALYFGVVKATHCSLKLQNRKRIWDLIWSPLSELICLRWSGNLPLHPFDMNKGQLRWREVCGNLQPLVEPPGIGKWSVGCKRFRKQCVYIPTLLRQVVVTTILIENATYVTGIGFNSNEGLEVYLGYTAERKKSSLSTTTHYMDATSVQGFILAVGSRGIQGLQFITYAGRLSQWFGCPDGLPKTHRLATFKSITALEAGFDVRVTSFQHCYQFFNKAC